LLHLISHPIELLEIDLVARIPPHLRPGHITNGLTSFTHSLQPPNYPPPKPRRMVLYIDWSELGDGHTAAVGLYLAPKVVSKVRLQSMNIYIATIRRHGGAGITDYQNLIDRLYVLDDAIENLIIDYAEGAEIDPQAGLSER
jgi:hypothetical protein